MYNCIEIVTILSLGVFGTTSALAQSAPPPVEGKNVGSPMETIASSADVEEEVEILRRLLDKSLTAVYGPTSPWKGPMGAGWSGGGMGASMMGGAMPPPLVECRAPDLEGVYLKDYGVVYTVTLPPPPGNMLPGPTVGVATRTPLTAWERTRKELRGEKIEDESKPVGGSPPLSEVILKVLADNGKHFTVLTDGERVTVAVTFRDDGVYNRQPAGIPFGSFGTPPVGGSSGPQGMLAPGGSTPLLPSQPGKPPSSPFVPGTEWVTNIRNGLTLGDLHVKQKNYSEAISAYHNAQDQLLKTLEVYKQKNPEDTGSVLTAAHLYLLLAKGYESAGDKDAAREAMEKVESLSKMAAAQTIETPTTKKALPATPPPLPSKLVVTASKKLLDEVGSGKMTFEAFRKAATVEYIKPPVSDKK